MKSVIFLRIAAALTLIHAALHTIGGVFGKPVPGPAEQVVAVMKTNHFLAFGNIRTYWDFYIGFGLGISIFLTVEAVAFWLLSSVVVREGTKARPLISVFALGYLAFALNSHFFFFTGPVIVEVLIALCLALAAFTARTPLPTESRPPATTGV